MRFVNVAFVILYANVRSFLFCFLFPFVDRHFYLGLLLIFSQFTGLEGCAHESPPQALTVSPLVSTTLRTTPIALTEVVILPQPETVAKKSRPMFSDEQLASDGNAWSFVPSAHLIQPNAILASTFHIAGLTAKFYPTLQAAKSNGMHWALIVAQERAFVQFPDEFPWISFKRYARADVELNWLFVNLHTYEILWRGTNQGTFSTELEVPTSLYDTLAFNADVATGDIEPQIHTLRLLLVRAYYEATKSLLQALDGHGSGAFK